MTLENAVQFLLVALVTFAVTAGIKAASKAWGRDLTGAIVPIVSVCVALATAYAPQIAAVIPAELQIAILAIAGALGAGGIHATLRRKLPEEPPAHIEPDLE